MPKLYDDAARLPGRRGSGMGAMSGGTRVAYLVTPVAVGGLAGTALSVVMRSRSSHFPALIGLVIVTEWNQRLAPPRTRVTRRPDQQGNAEFTLQLGPSA